MSDGFVDALISSPLGVSLLAVLEAGPTPDHQGWQVTSPNADPASVNAAVERLETVSFGTIVDAAVYAAVGEAGPWMGDAPAKIAAAYRQAERRLPIAEALADRFGDELHLAVAFDRQQWWTDGESSIHSLTPLFQRYDATYGAGEFSWAGLRTATDPPLEALVQMVAAWEIETGPVARWWLPVRPDARVFEIHRPEDWAALVTAHPRPGATYMDWELPGTNQAQTDRSPLRDVAQQRAARSTVRHHLVPDWRAVADHYDGVHLSWAGFITSEGCITDLGDGDVTMLRYWFSERTLWLADVFGEPTIAPDPGVDLSAGHHWPPRPPHVAVTLEHIHRLLGR